MEMHVEKHQEKSIIKIDKNKILGTEAGVFQNLVLDSIEQGSKNITIDLTNVDYVTSWGIGILVHAYTTCINRNVSYRLIGVNENVVNILQKIRLDKFFDIKRSA
jgi:anti-sigma B factor antagonist